MIDTAWFKTQQKRAGVTTTDLGEALGRDRTAISKMINGTQRISLDQAKIFATVLGVPLTDMVERLGLATPETAQHLAPGFAEADALPFQHRPEDPGAQIARALGASRPGIDVWQVKSAAMALDGTLPGDFILVDTHAAERCKAGDLVISQVYSRTNATTVLRRYEPPVLVAASANPDDRRVLVVDGANVVIRGKVIASWRI